MRLRSAYENMIKFNSERDHENQKKEQLLMIAREQKNRTMVANFQQAENIRFEAKASKQAQFFHRKLKQMLNQEVK